MRMPRTPEQKVQRLMNASAFTVRHWRGILLSIWAGTVGVFALLAWWGFANRDRGLGEFVFIVFGFVTLAMLLRFPRRLIRAMWAARGAAAPGTPPHGAAPRPPGPIDRTIIDADAVERDPPPRPEL